MLHRVYFIPGIFGFGRLAGYDYFTHMRVGMEKRFADAGVQVVVEDVPSPPTSSLRYRSKVLASTVNRSFQNTDECIHFVGHSTGGLDARLVASDTSNLGMDAQFLAFRPHIRTAISMNTPHYGTPVASYFTTVSGTRVLYALSLLTVVSLTLGEPSLAIFSRVVAGLGGVDSLLGGNTRLISSATDVILRFVDKDGRAEIADFLSKVRIDQSAVIQIMPEAMDMFNAAAENNRNIYYGSIVTAAPPPRSMRFARRIRSPYAAFSAAMYSTLYQFASQASRIHRYGRPTETERRDIELSLEHELSAESNDGIVPTLSMLWGELVWSGEADHLDILGHFHDDQKPAVHVDWLTSGAHFSRKRFSEMLDALVARQLAHA